MMSRPPHGHAPCPPRTCAPRARTHTAPHKLTHVKQQSTRGRARAHRTKATAPRPPPRARVSGGDPLSAAACCSEGAGLHDRARPASLLAEDPAQREEEAAGAGGARYRHRCAASRVRCVRDRAGSGGALRVHDSPGGLLHERLLPPAAEPARGEQCEECGAAAPAATADAEERRGSARGGKPRGQAPASAAEQAAEPGPRRVRVERAPIPPLSSPTQDPTRLPSPPPAVSASAGPFQLLLSRS